MKTIKLFTLIFLGLTFMNCDNDDNNNPNTNQCNFPGLTVEDANGNILTQLNESNLQTDYFPNNDGPGLAAVEVYETTNPSDNFIVTRALTLGAIDNNPEIRINNVNYNGVVTCQRVTGTAVGDELRFDIVITGLGEGELCIDIDSVNP